MKKLSTLLFFCFFLVKLVSSQTGYHIKVSPSGYENSKMSLSYYLGDEIRKVPTANGNDYVSVEYDGSFVFKGDEPLMPGMYLIIFYPNKNRMEIFVDEDNQTMEIAFEYGNILESIRYKGGSIDNNLSTDYSKYLQKKGKEHQQLVESSEPQNSKEEQSRKINEEVRSYQKWIIENYPKSLVAAHLKAGLPLNYPEFSGTDEEKQYKAWQYTRKHYFDNIDLGDPRLLRTPFLFEMVDNYIRKLTIPHPDSIIQSLDYVLKKMEPAFQTQWFFFRTYLNELLREDEASASDAIFVHLYDKYIKIGYFVLNPDDQKRIEERANKLRHTLVGNKAPNLMLKDASGKKFDLYGIRSKYTLLFFWDCSLPFLPDMALSDKELQVLQEINIKLVSICTENSASSSDDHWLHAMSYSDTVNIEDIYYIPSYAGLVLFLDQNKTIIAKSGYHNIMETFERINFD